MIISSQSAILNVDTFMAALQRLRLGMFRVVSSDNKSISTGWLLTDQLVVAFEPRSNQPVESGYICHQNTDTTQVAYEADLCYQPSLDLPESKAILLRLRQPVLEAALMLQTQPIESGAKVMILQFPRGEPRLAFSMGQVISIDDTILCYDADTEVGAAGAPVLNLNWEVIGYHYGKRNDPNKAPANEGTTLSGMFQNLRTSPIWPEIVAYHRLADVASTEIPALQTRSLTLEQLASDSALLPAAVQWAFDPATFSDEERDELEMMVIDSSSEQWILMPDERQRLLREAESLNALRQARGLQHINDPRQVVIDRILQGPPFDLNKVDEGDLSYWLQAVRWFEKVVPQLPSPSEVSQTLERRRIRSQFEPIAGTTFRGRKDELKRFERWFHQPQLGPLVVSGIGGVGKSSLVARFARSLPNDTLLLWLDFDRADIAPDDAPSLLSLIGQQASLQLTSFDGPDLNNLTKKATQLLPESEKATIDARVQEATVAMGQALRNGISDKLPPLLVLDGFEVAQHRQRYVEIWGVLELLLRETPSLRIIISGRAPVRNLTLGGREAESMELVGVKNSDADAWLLDQGIADANVRAQVIQLAKGVPLILRLAVRLAKAGDDLHTLPKNLRQSMVMGYLYDRILDRVIDASLKPVVEAVLVLRKVTPKLLGDVLTDTLPGKPDATSPETLSAEETFSRLARELAVVDANAVFSSVSSGMSAEQTLWIRPDLRGATLRLLETDKPDRVRELDRRAANWYATRDLTDEQTAAELVYHRLRLGDINGAKAAWNDGCAPYLTNAEDDLWPDAESERAWLKKKLKQASTPVNALILWEKDALERIQRAQSRGLDRILGSILSEQTNRSDQSPLRLYDAWLNYQQGNLNRARDLLQKATETEGPSGRDQIVLAAQLAIMAGDLPAADKLLAAVSDPIRWTDRSQGRLEVLAVKAARVRLTVNLDEEFKLLGLLKSKNKHEMFGLGSLLSNYDVVLPPLSKMLEDTDTHVYESISVPTEQIIPSAEVNLLKHRAELMSCRNLSSSWISSMIALSTDATALTNNNWAAMHFIFEEMPEEFAKTVFRLSLLSQQRIERITEDLFLMEASNNVIKVDPLPLSIVGTLAALQGWNFQLSSSNGFSIPLNDLLTQTWNQYIQNSTLLATQQGKLWAEKLAQTGAYDAGIKRWLMELNYLERVPESSIMPNKLLMGKESWLPLLLLYMLSPDPLETLCRRLLSLPETFIFQAPA